LADRLRTHTHEVIGQSERLLSQVTDAHRCARGYVITGQDELLDKYQRAVAAIPNTASDLRTLTADNPQQQHRLDQLQPTVNGLLEFLPAVIHTRQSSGLEPAADMVR